MEKQRKGSRGTAGTHGQWCEMDKVRGTWWDLLADVVDHRMDCRFIIVVVLPFFIFLSVLATVGSQKKLRMTAALAPQSVWLLAQSRVRTLLHVKNAFGFVVHMVGETTFKFCMVATLKKLMVVSKLRKGSLRGWAM